MTEQEQNAFDQMREAVERLQKRLVTKCSEQLVTFNFVDVDLLNLASEALTAANAVQQQAQEKDHLNVASQCRATASHPISQQIEVDGGNGTLFMLLMDAAHSIEQLMASHPQATEPAWRPIESAPKDGTEIIGCWPSYIDSGSFARVTCKYVGWSWVTNDYRETELAQPTYWMPLPPPLEAHHE